MFSTLESTPVLTFISRPSLIFAVNNEYADFIIYVTLPLDGLVIV